MRDNRHELLVWRLVFVGSYSERNHESCSVKTKVSIQTKTVSLFLHQRLLYSNCFFLQTGSCQLQRDGFESIQVLSDSEIIPRQKEK